MLANGMDFSSFKYYQVIVYILTDITHVVVLLLIIPLIILYDNPNIRNNHFRSLIFLGL